MLQDRAFIGQCLSEKIAPSHSCLTPLRPTITRLWTSAVHQRAGKTKYILRRGTLCIQTRERAHTLGIGCVDVSSTQTGYEPTNARTEDSLEDHESSSIQCLTNHVVISSLLGGAPSKHIFEVQREDPMRLHGYTNQEANNRSLNIEVKSVKSCGPLNSKLGPSRRRRWK